MRDALAGRVPHAESVRNLNTREDYDAALDEPQPVVHVRCFGPLRRPPAEVRAATLGAAAAAVGVALDVHVLAALNGDQIARDPLEPLAEGDSVAFMAADSGDERGGQYSGYDAPRRLLREGTRCRSR